MEELVPIALALFAAGVVQGTAGFGFGMVSMSVLPLFLDVRVAVPVVGAYGLCACAVVLVQCRRGVSRERVLPLLIGAFIGTPLGVYFLNEAEPRGVEAVLGVVLVAYAAHGLLRPRTPRPDRPESLGSSLLAGAAATLGGVLGGAFNTGAPPVILYITWRGWPPLVAKGTLQAFFLVSTLYQLALFWSGGALTAEVGNAWLRGLPGLGLGLAVGIVLGRRIDAATFRRLVLVLLLVLGANFLRRAF